MECPRPQIPAGTKKDDVATLDFVELGNRLMPNENEQWRSLLNTKLKAAAWESTKR